jgi:biuret amidohydrolase
MELDPRSTAVLAVHWLHDVVSPDGAFGPYFQSEIERLDAIANTAAILEAAREAGALVAYTRVVYRPDYADMDANCPLLQGVVALHALTEGSRGAEIIPELAPRPGDLVVDHTRVTGFCGTSLDSVLRARDIEAVVLTGVSTNLSVEGTAREATNLGYRSIVVSDACATDSEAAHMATLATMSQLGEVATSAEVTDALSRQHTA